MPATKAIRQVTVTRASFDDIAFRFHACHITLRRRQHFIIAFAALMLPLPADAYAISIR